MKKIRVGIIFGGKSGEHEVSIISAQSVLKAINKTKYEVVPIFINKKGQWQIDFGRKKLERKSSNYIYLLPDPTKKELVSKDKIKFNQGKIDVFFPLVHGTYGEDGSIQGLLELAGLPYVGAGIAASATGMDKDLMKKIFRSEGLPITKHLVLLRKDLRLNQQRFTKMIEAELTYPIFVKPANLGSSVGITKAHTRAELVQGLKVASEYDRKLIVEQGIDKAREIEVAVLGNDELETSVGGEIVPSKEFYDYEDKYILGKAKLIIPAPIRKNISDKIRKMAKTAFKSIDCSGMARVDFLIYPKTNEVYIVEINTNPGFTAISIYPKLWEASGVSYLKLIDRLIILAMERYNDKLQTKTEFPSKLLKNESF
ncbi:MAG: D-alanine--D-alanine ligase family protein [bacterium]|nr:D-alanine--D-alanine ligase family protein [bacterium]